jgi:hypothetical protein
MIRLFWLAFAVAAALPSSGFAQETVPRHHHTQHPAAQTAPPPAPSTPWPGSLFKPYASPGEGDDDAISRDPDDCMKGCIGGNPG